MSLNSLQDDMSRRAASMAAMAKRAQNPQEIQNIQKSLIAGVQSGAIQPFVGIPLIQDLTKRMTEAKAQMAQTIAGAGMQQPQGEQGAPQQPIAEQVMAQAAQESQGVEALPSNLPQEYAGGGIIAFEQGGPVERFQVGGQSNKYENQYDRYTREVREREKAEEEARARLSPEQRIRQDRASMMQPFAAAGDIIGGPYNYLAQTGESVANAIGIPRIGKALGIYDKDVTSVGIPRIGQGGDTPFMDMARQYAAGQTAPAPGAGINKDLGPVPGTGEKDVLGGRPTGGITTLPAGRPPAAAPANAAPLGQGPLAMPAPPEGKSAEAFAREQVTGLTERSDARLKELTAAQNANKMEGKPFDELKKTLEEEAKQAGAEKSDAKHMAIFKAGLAMMSGTSRNALENIGKGAMVGAEDYQKAAADLKKADKERQKQFAAIEEARRAEARDDIKTKNAQLDKAYTAGQRIDELGSSAISAGFGVDKTQGMDVWKTQFSGAATQRAAETSAAATRYSADVGASSRIQAAETKALLAGLGGGKGALTQDQLIKNRQTLADSPQITEYKKQLISQYGKNVVNQPGFQDAVNKQIDMLLMQMSAQPGASMGFSMTPAQQSLVSKYLNPR